MIPLKPAKGIMEKLSFVLSLNFNALVQLVDSTGLEFLPYMVKIVVILAVLSLPVLAVVLSIKLTKEPEINFGETTQTAKEAKSEGKKEKEEIAKEENNNKKDK